MRMEIYSNDRRTSKIAESNLLNASVAYNTICVYRMYVFKTTLDVYLTLKESLVVCCSNNF